MTYGVEAVIPLETGFPTLRTSSFNLSSNNGLLEKSLDLIEEKRESVMVQLVYYQHKVKLGTTKNPAWGKLRPNWERPYCITMVAGIGAYFLEDLDEHKIPRLWNANNLKWYYY